MGIRSIGSGALCALSYGSIAVGVMIANSYPKTGASIAIIGAAVSIGRIVKYNFDKMQHEKEKKSFVDYEMRVWKYIWIAGAVWTVSAISFGLKSTIELSARGIWWIYSGVLTNKRLSRRDALYLKDTELKNRHICHIQ